MSPLPLSTAQQLSSHSRPFTRQRPTQIETSMILQSLSLRLRMKVRHSSPRSYSNFQNCTRKCDTILKSTDQLEFIGIKIEIKSCRPPDLATHTF